MTNISGWSCVQRPMGDSRLPACFFNKSMCTYNTIEDGWWEMILCWKLRNYEVYKHMFTIFNRNQNYFSILPTLLKILHQDSLKICELFLYVKTLYRLLEKYQKQGHETCAHFTPQLQIIFHETFSITQSKE